MDTADLATQLISMRAAGTQQAINIAVLKKSFEMQKELVDMVVRSAPPPGMGTRVDKLA